MTKYMSMNKFILLTIILLSILHISATATKLAPTSTPKPIAAITTTTNPIPSVEDRWKTLQSVVGKLDRYDEIVPDVHQSAVDVGYDLRMLNANVTQMELALKKFNQESNSTSNRYLEEKILNASKIMLENSEFITRIKNLIKETRQHWNSTINSTLLVTAELSKKVLQQNIIISKLNASLYEMEKQNKEVMTNFSSIVDNSLMERVEKLENGFSTTTTTEIPKEGAGGIPVSSSWLIALGLAAYGILK